MNNQPILRWVKASERLPDNTGWYFVYKGSGHTLKDIFHFDLLKAQMKLPSYWDEIYEWLEEIPIESLPKEDKDWIERFKGFLPMWDHRNDRPIPEEETNTAARMIFEIAKEYAASLQDKNDWSRLLKIGSPEKWINMYTHYQELLMMEDVASWWAGEFDIANKERNELKEELASLQGSKVENKSVWDAALQNAKLHYIMALSDELIQESSIDFVKGAEWQKAQQGSKVSDEDDSIDSWLVIFYGALLELVYLKELRELEGETEEYKERKPKAWYAAKQAIDLWAKSDYGSLPLQFKGSKVLTEEELTYNIVYPAFEEEFGRKPEHTTKDYLWISTFIKGYKANQKEGIEGKLK